MPKVEITAQDHGTTVQDGLDWEGFSATYFPGRRRHDLEALVAYAAYKRWSPEGSETRQFGETIESRPLEAWENEGGKALTAPALHTG